MSEVKPALTPDEWAGCPAECGADERPTGPRCRDDNGHFWLECGDVWHHSAWDGEQIIDNPHGLAALCLHGQPFGFTRADEKAIRAEGNELIAWSNDAANEPEMRHMNERGFTLIRIANKIAALLPTQP